jgi:hypothetical protein
MSAGAAEVLASCPDAVALVPTNHKDGDVQ